MSEDDDQQTETGGAAKPPYEVGYGRPPLHSRFGQGNRSGRGRPKGSRNAQTLFAEAFAKRVNVKVDGREVKLSHGEIAMAQLAKKAAAGDQKALSQYLKYGAQWQEPEPPAKLSASEEQRNSEILNDLLSMARFMESQAGGAQSESGDRHDPTDLR